MAKTGVPQEMEAKNLLGIEAEETWVSETINDKSALERRPRYSSSSNGVKQDKDGFGNSSVRYEGIFLEAIRKDRLTG